MIQPRTLDVDALLADEFTILFPRLQRMAGQERLEDWRGRYFDLFPPRDWERFERLRAFPLFLRNERHLGRPMETAWVDLASWEWAEFSALYSPADEIRESRKLQRGEYVFNPTAQILRLETDLSDWLRGKFPPNVPAAEKQMVFIYRCRKPEFTLAHKVADWATAAIVDHLMDNGRMTEEHLLRELEAQFGRGHEVEWRERICALSGVQLLLEG